ncbi:succinylglutamate desuccinylase/aspartoacylase family protein [Neptunomonas japonica]|uniref:Succinylglutamate desuccinylase/aspartoacylase n=1 Tax=Neptunomonas japonica JAMM 1380 TaxID=1441457 RepID=A0A7R6SX78_9GAMM|nr:succinylglutamate desuccinylase/aspartoacylase family protein [Neptunomonas japonica]BBB31484.1 succinylglutamate desuccinylase/aspartoacylase [Neptunomonas japonica JAMM 1380]
METNDLIIGGFTVRPGETKQIEIAVAKLYTDTDICIPVHVRRSKKPGPTVFVSAAVHGDELNGIEIIRRLIQLKSLKISSGTLILVPMLNVYGVLNQSRYMPDRRDLNRCFPGSAKGSLAGRVADIFLEEIVKHCDYGIDLHTGAIHRSNLPQIRANLNDPETRTLAEVFGVPVLLNADLRDGSLRQAAVESDTRILLYEAGQALRFDELSIQAGVKGVLNVIRHLGLVNRKLRRKILTPYIANHSSWVRANCSGIVHDLKNLGDQVQKGTPLAEIGSPFGEVIDIVTANKSGIIIGKQNIPLVQEGDAMFHIAFFSEDDAEIAEKISEMQDALAPPIQDIAR